MAETAEYDLYDALNLQHGASPDEVRAAFRDLSRLYHPDKQRDAFGLGGGGGGGSGSSQAGAERAFMRIHRAYRVLGDDLLRSFYDRYGLGGVRLAESLSDDEGEDTAGRNGQLSVPEDRLKELEARVLGLMRKRDELRTQRLLALQGTFTLAAAVAPGHHGAHARRRYRLQYSATSHSVQIAVCENLKLTVGCASHVQGPNGVGAAKLALAASSTLGPQTAARAAVNVTGSAPELDVSITRSLNEHCTVQQKASMSGDGSSMSISAYPWLSQTMRGNVGVSCGADPSVTLGLLKRSSSSGHSARAFLTLQPGSADLGGQVKFKPSRDFSVKVAPSISTRGWACTTTCTKVLDTGLTKLHWALRVRARSLQVRLTLVRCGLRFSFPLELWPEAAGPLTVGDMAILVGLWAAPPLVVRLLHSVGQAVCWGLRGGEAQSSPSSGADGRADSQEAAASASMAAEEAEAREQRRLLAREAERCRAAEAAARGLVVLCARYGDPDLVAAAPGAGPGEPGAGPGVGPGQGSVPGAGPGQGAGAGAGEAEGVIDVTDCLMAKVRCSRLHISDAPKSSLLGFCNPYRGAGAPKLHIRYRFGGVEHARTFGDTDVVVLP